MEYDYSKETDIAKTLLTKLTKEEIHQLCFMFDDGRLDEIMNDNIIPQDALNFPDEYK